NKLQEKQTLLAGLGMLEAMANQNLQQYKSIMIANDESSAAISTLHQIEALATQLNLNLEKINLKFLHKIIPVTAVSLGATYNNMIINQVLDISRTVFAPTPKLTAQPLH
ncbi:MAG: EcsC family protein, partial [Moraxella sp.]